MADECDIANGPNLDCNANGVPDICDSACPVFCDADNDRCIDDLDDDPLDGNVCADTDNDGCDDCSSGVFKPSDDGTDNDADGICEVGDCDDGNPDVWIGPGPVGALVLAASGGVTTLSWLPPASPGGNIVQYDTLRSLLPSNFNGPAICLETDGPDTTTDDGPTPGSGGAFHYLIRAVNSCPGSVGTLGTDSNGTERTGIDCP